MARVRVALSYTRFLARSALAIAAKGLLLCSQHLAFLLMLSGFGPENLPSCIFTHRTQRSLSLAAAQSSPSSSAPVRHALPQETLQGLLFSILRSSSLNHHRTAGAVHQAQAGKEAPRQAE